MAINNLINRKAIQYLILLLFVIGFAASVHFWTTDRKGVLRTLYPVPAMLSQWSVGCSRDAPAWLKEIAELGIEDLKALASQVGYIDSTGNLHHCESGWQGRMLLSPRVTQSSKFLYGSLTKPITSAAVLSFIRDGLVDYEKSILNYFRYSGFDNSDRKGEFLTVGNLLRYKAGVVGEVFSNESKPWCPYNINEIFSQKYWQRNQNEHQYSNLNYCLLGEIVARSTNTDYRSAARNLFDLDSLGVGFVNSPLSDNYVKPDYRYHDFYRNDVLPKFDYFAISSSAGMMGSASSYAELMYRILGLDLPGFVSSHNGSCDIDKIRECYGNAFYTYRYSSSDGSEVFNLKEGYMPGFSGLVAINEESEVFVWLGNSDTPNARSGHAMKKFIDQLVGGDF